MICTEGSFDTISILHHSRLMYWQTWAGTFLSWGEAMKCWDSNPNIRYQPQFREVALEISRGSGRIKGEPSEPKSPSGPRKVPICAVSLQLVPHFGYHRKCQRRLSGEVWGRCHGHWLSFLSRSDVQTFLRAIKTSAKSTVFGQGTGIFVGHWHFESYWIEP